MPAVTRFVTSPGIEKGIFTDSTKERLLALEARKKELQSRSPPPPVPRLHPRLAEVYREKVAKLQEALDREDVRAEAAEALRGLIGEIRLTPGPAEGNLRVELYGELGSISAMSQNKNRTSAGEVRFSLVAGVGFEPTTFRL